mmetsp:Transcript_17568/g.53573  ORF Transcript_17568/g.53573 Transcript_17568/m.53573 type:complete len:100 (-) Transcript_17568:266-565(-)
MYAPTVQKKKTMVEQHIHRSLADAELEADPCTVEAAATFCNGDPDKLSVITGSDVSENKFARNVASVLRRTKTAPLEDPLGKIEPLEYAEPLEWELGNL